MWRWSLLTEDNVRSMLVPALVRSQVVTLIQSHQFSDGILQNHKIVPGWFSVDLNEILIYSLDFCLRMLVVPCSVSSCYDVPTVA